MKRIFCLIFLIASLAAVSCTEMFPDGDNEGTSSDVTEQPSDKPTDEPGDGSTDEPGEGQEPVTQPETVIYYDNLDKATANGSYLDRWDGYINAEGWGAENITYSGSYMQTRSNFASMGYPGASGLNGFYCSAHNGTTLKIAGIRIPSNGTGSYRFTAGINTYINNSNLPPDGYVSVSVYDGSTSATVTYSKVQYDKWYFITGDFELSESLPSTLEIHIQFKTSNIRLDDPKLIWYGEPSDTPEDSGHVQPPVLTTAYFEYPQTVQNSSDYVYGTLRGKTYSSKKDVRNYSYCYDTRRHNPMWVAFPCHQIYWEGGYTRPVRDPWRPNPDLTEAQQSVIYPTDWNDWPWSATNGKPVDNKYYWTYTTSSNVTLSKGHMMRSAERGAGNANVLFGLNEQTFYPTNILPECDAYVTASNGEEVSHWSMVEYLLPDKWACSDTVYVVVGCWYDRDQYEAKDAMNWNTSSPKSKICKVPAARYKAFLRTKKGNTGKRISQCSADELMAIAFWFPQCLEPQSQLERTSMGPLSEQTMSVADLEKKIGGGFKFFPDVPDKTRESFNPADWPGLSAVINDPLNSSFDMNQLK